MQFEGAHLRERNQQGGYTNWWVIVVSSAVLNSPTECQKTRAGYQARLRQPVVLMAQDSRGVASYWGKPDLVDYMATVPFEAVPWERFTFS
jgi:hypothetical protein